MDRRPNKTNNSGKRRYFQQQQKGGGGGGHGGRGSNNRLRLIEWGSSALYFTLNGDEKRAVGEAKNLLDRYYSQLYPDEDVHENPQQKQQEKDGLDKSADEQQNSVENPSELDVADQLANICENSKLSKNSRNVRGTFWQVDSGVKNILLFTSPSITPKNVYEFCDVIVNDCQQNSNCRFLARLLPVETCCSCDLAILNTTVEALLSKHLREWPSNDPPPTYAVEFKSRHNNDMVGRQVIFDMVTDVMQTQSPASKVNLTQPDLLISINVLKKTALLACIQKYFQRNKFSVRVTEEEKKVPPERNGDVGSETAESSPMKISKITDDEKKDDEISENQKNS